jgi:hypothetical protein
MGVVVSGSYGQVDLATKHFRIARAIRPSIALPAHVNRRETVLAFARARR